MTTILDGDASLRRRPVARIIEPLRSMGAVLHARRNDSLPPLTVVGRTPLRAIDVATPVPSAQVKSAILLAGLRADGRTTVRESVATRDHTERMLRARGVPVDAGRHAGRRGGLDGRRRAGGAGGAGASPRRRLRGRVLARRGRDPSRRRADAPRRRRQPDAPRRHRHRCARWAPTSTNAGRVRRRRPRRRRGRRRRRRRAARRPRRPLVGASRRSTSALPTSPRRSTRSRSCASPPPSPSGTTVIRGAGELRHKESDRIAGIVGGPRGARRDDRGRRRRPHDPRRPRRCAAPTTDSLDDHRLAMTFAIAGLVASGQTIDRAARLGRHLLSRLLRRPRKGASMTKRVVLIGHPVAHSLSGAMQQAAFDSLGIDATLRALGPHADRARRRDRRAARATTSSARTSRSRTRSGSCRWSTG